MPALKPLLIEIGVEEIPAGISVTLAEQLYCKIDTLLNSHNFAPDNLVWGVTPRRLLVHATACHVKQHDYNEEIWGPPEHVAYSDDKPTAAALGFARKSGLELDDFELADKGDGKGRYMRAIVRRKGLLAIDVLAEALPGILRGLPSPKQMQWQDGEARADGFIRPVRWIVARLGGDVIPFSFAGVEAGRISHGHRIHGSQDEISVHDPFVWLEKQAVVADRDKRRRSIADQLTTAAMEAGVEPVEDPDLLEEVTDLTEWPHVITGRFDADFLRLPAEVSRIELKHHQRCFSSRDADERTSNVFFAVANIASKDPLAVARGNERVVNARLADAAFYFDRDPKETLDQRVGKLSEIIFQDGLGMVGDQVRRLRGFVLDNAGALGVDADSAQRAAYLCKSDLTTGLVGEFPELQGYMGGIYARMDGESRAVAEAIEHHYAPAGADDALPENRIARAIGIAERADKLLGYFHLGRIPTASADPFGLRRAAIGLIRLLEDGSIAVEMTLGRVLGEAAKQWNQQRVTIAIEAETVAAVHDFVIERWLGMAGSALQRQALTAAIHAAEERPAWRNIEVARLLSSFADSEEGQAVTAANKRIANILKKAGEVSGAVDPAFMVEAAEKALFAALVSAEQAFPAEPKGQLQLLAGLREPVDRFFDDVMVMADDENIRRNRLALLARLRGLFLRLADLSRL